MKRTVTIATALIIAVCAITASSQNGRPNRPGPGMPGRFGGRMMSCPAIASMPPQQWMIDNMGQTLGLTKDQTAKLRKASTTAESILPPLRMRLANSSKALHLSILAPRYSSKQTKALALKAEKAEAKLVAAEIDVWTQMRSILTAKQMAELSKMMTMGPRPEFGGPGHGGPRPFANPGSKR